MRALHPPLQLRVGDRVYLLERSGQLQVGYEVRPAPAASPEQQQQQAQQASLGEPSAPAAKRQRLEAGGAAEAAPSDRAAATFSLLTFNLW